MKRHFALTSFVGSALLFTVQPMVARALLPHTGGVPALWNTCSVFFQLALLAGYALTHGLTRRAPPRVAAPAHVGLVALAALTLPFVFDTSSVPEADPTAWILAALTRVVAPAFVLLSTGAPMVQRWYVGASHDRDASSLAAASNAGSLTALLAYPLAIEPLLALDTQQTLFRVGYGVYVVLLATCAWQARAAVPSPVVSQTSLPSRAWWRYAALAAVPSSMMLGLTAHIATDVGSFPLLWVLPLALYLASFAVTFARPPAAPGARVVGPYVALLAMMFLFTAPQVATRLPLIVAHFALFTATAWILHGELARAMPTDASVTSFQLAIAVGGAAGGAFNALVAPHLFTRVTEYPLAMVGAVLLLPDPPPPPDPRARQEQLLRDAGLDPLTVLGPHTPPRPRPRWTPADLVVVALVGAVAALLFALPPATRTPSFLRFGAPLALLVPLSVGRRVRLALGLAVVLVAARVDRSVLDASRTFFGVQRVEQSGGVRRFLHGTTLHGLQYTSAKMHATPLGYYEPQSPIAEVMRALGPSLDGRRVGVVGLGVGMLLAHARPAQRWTFYELDPDVVRIARRWFTWLRDARAPWNVVVGDARRTLSRDRDARFGLLVLDAFSSDAIPTHLLTREALAMYRTRLDTRGVLAFHVTNRHVRLAPVLAGLAHEAGLVAVTRAGWCYSPDGPVKTTWVLLARERAHLEALSSWETLRDTGAPRWSDAHTNVLAAMAWR